MSFNKKIWGIKNLKNKTRQTFGSKPQFIYTTSEWQNTKGVFHVLCIYYYRNCRV